MPKPHSKGTPTYKSLHYATGNDLQTIEALRHKLVELFFQEGSFSSPSVLQLSQELDEYIVAIQKNHENNKVTVNVE
ncbi:aspartyl-phosphate phosphatase Spo0E family protein [Brevibacillus halotolerans]|nr:aspartyl-phosphate phosphatase Spo0E family protein [Brevibacillus halotolerans]